MFLVHDWCPWQAIQSVGVYDEATADVAHLAESVDGAAVRDIAAALGVSESPWTIREDLAALKHLGLVQSTGWGRGARWELTGQ